MNRILAYAFCAIALIFTACHKDEPDAVLEYPIITEYQTMSQKQYQLYTAYYTYPEGEEDTKSEVFSYIRTAVLVKKIPDDANLAIYYTRL